MLASLLSLPGEGLEGSLLFFPLAEAAASVPAATAVTERLACSSLRASGLGCVGGACSDDGCTFSSCCSLWLCKSRSWTRSSKIASCSSWIAWFRWVFLFYRATKHKTKHTWCEISLVLLSNVPSHQNNKNVSYVCETAALGPLPSKPQKQNLICCLQWGERDKFKRIFKLHFKPP